MDIALSFGDWVKQRRVALGFTQKELAERVGCALITIKKIEQDMRKPSSEISLLLAKHLLIPEQDQHHFINVARGMGAPPLLPISPSSSSAELEPTALVTTTNIRPFVMRNSELSQLQAHLDKILTGNTQVVFVSGESGSGKSSLLGEFARRAQISHPRLIVAGGSCNAFSGAGDPYLPFRDAMMMLLGETDGPWASVVPMQPGLHRELLPQIARALIQFAPDVVDVLAPVHILLQIANTTQSNANIIWQTQLQQLIEQQRARATYPAPKQLFEQIRLLLESLAQQQPLLLLLDDLQWIDTASLNLLFHLGQRLQHSPILIVGAFRPSEINSWRGRDEQNAEAHPLVFVRNEIQRRFGTLEISLDHETSDNGRSFVDAFLDTEANNLDQQFREQLLERTKGYPLFTVELLRTMQERGHIVQDQDGRWNVTQKLNWDTLPTRVEVVIEQRINRLPSECQESLKVASVIGEEFAAEIVAQVSSEQPQSVINRLSDILANRHRLLKNIGSRRLRSQRLSQYKFQHILFQNYLYSTLDESRRSYLHELVGIVIETIYAEDPDLLAATAVQLAHHFEKANLPIKTVPYLLLAGRRAMQLSAYENAIAHFEQGLSLLEMMPPSKEHDQQELKLLVGMGNSLVAVRGNAVEAVGETFRRVLALAEKHEEHEQQALALFNLWRFYSDRADYTKCNEIAEQLQRLAKQSQNSSVHLTVDHVLWTMSLYAGDFVRARHHAEQGIAWYQPERHHMLTAAHAGHDPGMCCRVFAAYALWYLGYPDQARQRSREAVAIARHVNHPFSIAMALTLSAELHLFCQDSTIALTYLEESLHLAKIHNFSSWLELGAIFQGWAMALSGQAEKGIQLMLYGLDANRTMVGKDTGLHCFAQLAEAYRRAGQPEEGLALLTKALDTSDKSKLRDWVQWHSELYRLRGELRLQQISGYDRNEFVIQEIETDFLKAIDIAQKQQAKLPELRATTSHCRLLLHQGKKDLAYQKLNTIYAWFQEGFDIPDLQEAHALLQRLQ